MNLQIAVNDKNDIFMNEAGNLALVRNIDAVKEDAQQSVQAMTGEMLYAVDRGMPNFRVVWNGAPNIAQFEAALRRELLKVTDVIGVPEVSAKINGEEVNYSATIDSTYGTGVIANGLPISN